MSECVVGQIPSNAFAAVSPGFQFGRFGVVNAGSYLHAISTVPSNTAGVVVPLDGQVVKAFLTCISDATFTVDIQRRVGNVFTTIASVSLVAARTGSFDLAADVAAGDELTALVSAGSGENIQMGLSVQQAV